MQTAGWVRGMAALELAEKGAALFVFNEQQGWTFAGDKALDRAKKMLPHATWIYGVRAQTDNTNERRT